MSKNKTEIIQKIISDDKCLDRILAANNDDDVKQVFEDGGVTLTDSQVQNLRKIFEDQLIKLSQVDDENLEKICGGKDYKNAAYKGGGYGGAYGMWAGAGLGAIVGVVDAGIKIRKGNIDSSWDVIKGILKASILTSAISGAAGLTTGTIASVISEGLKE